MAAPVSVIIPTLDSARHLPRALAPLVDGTQEGLIREVIVSDGGSRDETLEIADAAGCVLVSGKPGRAKQLLNGVAHAKGKWLLILHPQTSLARGWPEEVSLFLRFNEARKRAAVFKLAFDDHSAKGRLFWARLRANVMKMPHGDQGLLISRFLYDGLNGYRDVTHEDIDLARRIGAKRLVFLETEAFTSADKYRYAPNAAASVGMMARYFLGADPVELAKR
ncbi:MAG: glycosyltransferase [Hyphomonadaceae bacterium]|nr:glycosyltransferase [Hyphomonadaceae bacterium]MCA8886883.1 glycosyltransferase [Hyphomonadaceae bacterium]